MKSALWPNDEAEDKAGVSIQRLYSTDITS